MKNLLTIIEFVIVVCVAICISAGLVYLSMLGIDSILPYGEYGLLSVLGLLVLTTIGSLLMGSSLFWMVIDLYSNFRDYICNWVKENYPLKGKREKA